MKNNKSITKEFQMYKCALLLLGLFVCTHANFIENGRNEIGGILSYSNTGDANHRFQLIQVGPFYNYYINSNFAIGPVLVLSSAVGGGNDIIEIDLGARATLGINIKNSLLYFAPGMAFVSISEKTGFGIPIDLGIKTIIANHFGIDFSLGYAALFGDFHTINNFGVFIGVFGLI
jgi:hypothetical protein